MMDASKLRAEYIKIKRSSKVPARIASSLRRAALQSQKCANSLSRIKVGSGHDSNFRVAS